MGEDQTRLTLTEYLVIKIINGENENMENNRKRIDAIKAHLQTKKSFLEKEILKIQISINQINSNIVELDNLDDYTDELSLQLANAKVQKIYGNDNILNMLVYSPRKGGASTVKDYLKILLIHAWNTNEDWESEHYKNQIVSAFAEGKILEDCKMNEDGYYPLDGSEHEKVTQLLIEAINSL